MIRISAEDLPDVCVCACKRLREYQPADGFAVVGALLEAGVDTYQSTRQATGRHNRVSKSSEPVSEDQQDKDCAGLGAGLRGKKD